MYNFLILYFPINATQRMELHNDALCGNSEFKPLIYYRTDFLHCGWNSSKLLLKETKKLNYERHNW